jgi:hypothetical protein
MAVLVYFRQIIGKETGMSEPIHWQTLTPDERTQLVVEKVLDVIIPAGMSVERIPYSNTEAAWSLMSWFIEKHPGASYEVSSQRRSIYVQIRMYPQGNIDLPVQRYSAKGYALPEVICIALLRACDVEVIDDLTEDRDGCDD